MPERHPVLLVHGIFDGAAQLDRLARSLRRAGIDRVHAMDLEPADGHASITELAAQVDAEARELRTSGSGQLDVVGFSMGALVARYWLQRCEGRQHTRRFVSIAGPHRGTQAARFLGRRGARDMRPGSPLINDLDRDTDPFGAVEVTTLWTPFDLMILPPESSRLMHAQQERRIPVLLHRWMVTDRRVLDAVTTALVG